MTTPADRIAKLGELREAARGDAHAYSRFRAMASDLLSSVEALGAALEAYPGWSDDVEEADRLHWWRLAQDALATIPDLEEE